MSVVFLFPGQGAQRPGMGKELHRRYRVVQNFFSWCSEFLQMDVCQLLFESSEEELQQTDNTQVAVTILNIAEGLVLLDQGISPSAVAGFSLGEYAALYFANSVSKESVLELVLLRGKIMEKSTHENEKNPLNSLGMTVVLGLDPMQIQPLLEKLGRNDVFLSMYNSPLQGVLSGPKVAREAATTYLRKHGVRRTIELRVGGAFHCSYMNKARQDFEEAIRHIEFLDPQIPIYSNVTASQIKSGAELKKQYLDQLIFPVQWIQEEDAIWKECNPEKIYELGPGTVLTGLWKAWKAEKDNNTYIPDIIKLDMR